MMTRLAIAFLIITALLTSARDAVGQTAANVLLVINEASPASQEIGSYYAQKRNIPAGNLIRLRLPVGDDIERTDYERQLEAPLQSWLLANFAEDRILYI